ncbi:MAG: glycosyltransferase family 2 protein [Chloroflexota bacterium]
MPTQTPDTAQRLTAHPAQGAQSARALQRAGEALPGVLAWLVVSGVLLAVWQAREALLWTTALLAVYVAARFVLAAAAQARGLRLVRQWECIDWRAEYEQRAELDSLPHEEVHHLVLLPSVDESDALLRRALDRLAAWSDAQQSMSVVLAVEAAAPGAPARAHRLRRAYADRFRRVLVTVHPPDLPGETVGKSANLAWALSRARRILSGDADFAPDQTVVTVMDADTLWHPAYFDCLTTLFATDPARHETYWQAPIRYHGNVWAAHPLLRPLHAQASAWELAYLAAPWWMALPMSSYSLSLRLLDEAGGWDAGVIADEWHMAIKSFFARRGRQRVQPVFLPFLAHATTARTVRATLAARYRQTLRHAWGAREIGYALACARQSPETPRRAALQLVGRVAHDNLLAGVGALLLAAGTQLPALVAPGWVRAHLLSAPFVVINLALLVTAGMSALLWAWDVRLRQPRPTPWTARARLAEGIALLLLPTLTALCVTLPVLHAQTRLMLGCSLRFTVTAKE